MPFHFQELTSPTLLASGWLWWPLGPLCFLTYLLLMMINFYNGSGNNLECSPGLGPDSSGVPGGKDRGVLANRFLLLQRQIWGQIVVKAGKEFVFEKHSLPRREDGWAFWGVGGRRGLQTSWVVKEKTDHFHMNRSESRTETCYCLVYMCWNCASLQLFSNKPCNPDDLWDSMVAFWIIVNLFKKA